MGGGGSKPDPSDQICMTPAQTRLLDEEEGTRIMQNRIDSLQEQLKNSKSETNQDRSWMKSTMETFLSSQSEMKDQYKEMLREMVQKDSFYAQERANADARHMQQLNAMKEEMGRMREDQERTQGSLRDDMRQERERIQREQQAAIEAVRQNMKEDKERSQQNYAKLMETMKEEKELLLKRHDDQMHTLKDEMKEERTMMQKNLNERVETMNQESQARAKQHESHVQTLETTMRGEKEVLQKHHEDIVSSMAEERKRQEQIYTDLIHTLREEKKEKDEQMQTMKKEMTEDKHKMQEAHKTRIQKVKAKQKEKKESMTVKHTQLMQEEMKRLALMHDHVCEEKNQERQSMDKNIERFMLLVERRDAQFLDMIKAMQKTMLRLLGPQSPSMIQYQQANGNGQSPQTGESQYGNSGNDQPTTVDGRNSPATSYQQQDDLRPQAAGNGIIYHEIPRTQMTCQYEPDGSGQMNSPGDPEAEEKRREDTAGKEVAATHHVQTQDPYAMPPRPSQSGQSAIPTPLHTFVDHDSSPAAPPGQMGHDDVYPPRGESVIPPYSGGPAGEAPFGSQAGGENSVGHGAGRMPPSIPQAGRMTPAGHQETSYPTKISDTGYEERQFGQRRGMETEVPQPGLQDLHGPVSPLSGDGVHDRQPFLSGGRGEGVAHLYGPGDAYPQPAGASGTQDAALPPAAQLPHRGTSDTGPLDLATASASKNRKQAESGVTADSPSDVADDEMEDMQSFETLSISDKNNQE